MPLTPPPNEALIEAVRNIALLNSFDYAATLIDGLKQAQWDAMLSDLTAWETVKNDYTIIKGDGVDINSGRDRLDITNRVRRRLGLNGVDESGNAVGTVTGDVYCSYTPPRSDCI